MRFIWHNFALLLSIALVSCNVVLYYRFSCCCCYFCCYTSHSLRDIFVVAIAGGNFCFANFNLIWLFAYLPHTRASPARFLPLSLSLSLSASLSPPTLHFPARPSCQPGKFKCSLCQQAFLRIFAYFVDFVTFVVVVALVIAVVIAIMVHCKKNCYFSQVAYWIARCGGNPVLFTLPRASFSMSCRSIASLFLSYSLSPRFAAHNEMCK